MKLELNPTPEQIRILLLGFLILLGVKYQDLVLLVGL